jgi:DNA-binding transcriptional ArsR family regulator
MGGIVTSALVGADLVPKLVAMSTAAPALAWHLTARLCRNRVIAARPGDARRIARIVFRQARPGGEGDPGLLAFSVPDTHMHLLLACDRKRAGIFANHLLGGLVCSLGLEDGFDRAWLGPVKDQGHLRSTVHYILRQHQHHETEQDPFREASNLPDLLGMRTLGAYTAGPVRRLLPRLRRSGLSSYMGGPCQAGSHPQFLADATAAVVGAESVQARGQAVWEARVAAAHWAHGRGLSLDWIAQHLRISPRTVRRHLKRKPEGELLRGIGLQVGLREAHQPSRALTA